MYNFKFRGESMALLVAMTGLLAMQHLIGSFSTTPFVLPSDGQGKLRDRSGGSTQQYNHNQASSNNPTHRGSVMQSTPNTNFSGIIARPFKPWDPDLPLPCFPREDGDNWMTLEGLDTGFLFIKPYKTGSSTSSGINLRISRNVAQRQQQSSTAQSENSKTDFCRGRSGHGSSVFAGYLSGARKRKRSASFLWTIVRDPTKRAISQFFHLMVSRQHKSPNDANFQKYLRGDPLFQDYYLKFFYTQAKLREGRAQKDPVEVANHILNEYDFIAVTERMDESATALMMLLDLPMSDILYLSAKTKGGYDDGGYRGSCTYIWPSFVSPGMKEFFASEFWQDNIANDSLLHQAVNASLDLTIDQHLGGHGPDSPFSRNLETFRRAQQLAQDRCLGRTIFPCDASGQHHTNTSCLWEDSGCGATCLDEIAHELGLD